MTGAPLIPTFTTGDVLHAADLNQLRDGVMYGYNQFPHAYARQAVSTTTLQNITWTKIGFDTVEIDYDGSFNQSGEFVCSTGGWWQCCGNIAYPWGNPSTNDRGARFSVNGTSTPGAVLGWSAGSIVHGSNICSLIHLRVGDCLTLEGYQNTGGSLDTVLNYQAAMGRSETSFLDVALMVADPV